ncbi:MAG: histidine phosphatase family protein [Gammaproteobacteria bacterium]
MRLYLVRHGDALAGADDHLRPLSARGRADIAELAAFLALRDIAPARIYHSGRLRALQSAQVIALALGCTERLAQTGGVGPEDSAQAFASGLTESAAELMLVGHQPFLGRVASILIRGSEDAPVVAMSTASALCLSRQRDCWLLEWLRRPSREDLAR